MKAMIISVTLSVILLGLVIADSIYVSDRVDSFIDEAKSAEFGDTVAAEKLCEEWEEFGKFVSLTIGEDYVHSIQCALGSMAVFSENEQKANFEASRNEAAEALAHIRRHHSFSLDNII